MNGINKRASSFVLCLTMVLTICLYPVPADAAGATEITFYDGDADQVYFNGDTLTFNLTSIPGITVDTPARVSFGLIGSGGSFVPTEIITGLMDGSGESTGYYTNATILAIGGTFSSNISGTIANGLPIGAIAVRIYVDTDGPGPNPYINLLQGQTPDCIPLTYGTDPALVGIDTVLAAESIICDPVLGSGAQNSEDLYDLDITFSKTIMPGVTGSIAFTNLNFFDSSDELQNLDEGMNMNATSAAIDEEEAFVIGIDQSALSNLADDGATISVSSASFSGLTADAFDTEAVSGTGTISNLTIVGNTVSFDVNHFSDYKMTRKDLQARIDQAKTIIGSSFTAVEGVDTNLITSLEAKSGMSATGVDITKVVSTGGLNLSVTAPGGSLTYNATSYNGAVTLELSYGGLTDSAILTSVTVPAIDNTSPIPGNSGTIISSSVASSSVVLSWTAASDGVTPASALKYYVIRSSSNNIADLASLTNGTLLNSGGTANITTYTVAGLTASTTYYFNIGVRDRGDNDAAYTSLSVTTTASGGGGGGGGGGGSTDQTATPPVTNTKGNTVTSTTTVNGTMDAATGKTTASLSKDSFTPMLENVKQAESSGQQAIVEIKVDSGAQAREVEIEIPKTSFSQVAQETKAQVSIAFSLGTVTFDETAVQTINESAQTGDIQISIAKVDPAGLSPEMQSKIGDAPVYDFSVKSGSSEISQFGGGSVNISVPYTLKDGENANSLVVYYINASGEMEAVRGAFDADTQTVRFVTSHFSKFAIAYNEVNFDDVSSTSWYNNAVRFIAAREITTGTDENSFSPNAKLTRAQFLVMVMKAYGIEPEQDVSNNFSDAGNAYYTAYLAKAKTLGLSDGDGNNQFGPDNNITRQDMFTLLYRTLDILGELPESEAGKKLSDFSDSDQIKSYAQTPMEALVSSGSISGSNGKLTPQGTSTRAEMAQVLFQLLSK